MTMSRMIRVALLTLGVLGSVSLFGAGPADAESELRQQAPRCTITSLAPAAVAQAGNGYRTSAGRANVVCNQVAHVRVEVQLWADDVARDDLIGGTYTYWNGRWAEARYVGNRGYCDEDIGPDEVFSRSRVGIVNANGTINWSTWARGDTYAVSC